MSTSAVASSNEESEQPSIARVYDYSLGGKDNYQPDRDLYDRILRVAPHQGEVSWLNRRWQGRVVHWLAEQAGVGQFLDLGSGLPTVENTHEVAQRRHHDNVVVYVDNDPTCCAHGRALLRTNQNTFFTAADLTEPDKLLADPVVTDHIDFTKPVAVLQCGTLHHVPDEADPAAIMVRYVEALPAGSFVAISHFWDPAQEDPELSATARRLEDTFLRAGLGSGFYRTRSQIQDLFAGLEMMEPGLVGLDQWWPAGPAVRPLWPEERLILGGLAVTR